MSSNFANQGEITVFTGPPGRKTEYLLWEEWRHKEIKKKLGWKSIAFHHQGGHLESPTSEFDLVIKGRNLTKPLSILDFVKRNPQVKIIVVDDCQFTRDHQALTYVLDSFAKEGKLVFVSGVDQDFQGIPFKATSYVMAVADRVRKIPSYCRRCGAEATKSVLDRSCPREKKEITPLSPEKHKAIFSRHDFLPVCKRHFYNQDKVGKLSLIAGPMFSGKTLEVLRVVESLEVSGKKYRVFYPERDRRWEEGKLITRGVRGVSIEEQATPVKSPKDILEFVERESSQLDTVLVDEFHLFEKEEVPEEEVLAFINDLNQSGVDLVISGLDMDFLGEPFNYMPELFSLADEVRKLSAVCKYPKCNQPATHTARKTLGNERILLGDEEEYEPRCRRHHGEYLVRRCSKRGWEASTDGQVEKDRMDPGTQLSLAEFKPE